MKKQCRVWILWKLVARLFRRPGFISHVHTAEDHVYYYSCVSLGDCPMCTHVSPAAIMTVLNHAEGLPLRLLVPEISPQTVSSSEFVFFFGWRANNRNFLTRFNVPSPMGILRDFLIYPQLPAQTRWNLPFYRFCDNITHFCSCSDGLICPSTHICMFSPSLTLPYISSFIPRSIRTILHLDHLISFLPPSNCLAVTFLPGSPIAAFCVGALRVKVVSIDLAAFHYHFSRAIPPAPGHHLQHGRIIDRLSPKMSSATGPTSEHGAYYIYEKPSTAEEAENRPSIPTIEISPPSQPSSPTPTPAIRRDSSTSASYIHELMEEFVKQEQNLRQKLR